VKCRRGLLCSPWWLTWHDTWHDVALSYLDVVYKVLASVKLHRGFRLATYARIVIQPLMPISARQNWNLAAGSGLVSASATISSVRMYSNATSLRVTRSRAKW
jgi:hypothetical protein